MEAMDYLEKARQVIRLERGELLRLEERLDNQFVASIGLLLKTLSERRKIIVCGVGKSGNIGHKLAATLNSTGATAIVLHPQNALHGDLGILDPGDAVIALSQSGETSELNLLLPHFKRNGSPLIAFTGGLRSTLAQNSDCVLDCQVQREACPLNLAPTSSTTVMLVLADALAMVLLEARGFRQEDFARFHPGGELGRNLLTRVRDVMRGGEALALVTPAATVAASLARMSRVRSGAAVVVDAADGRLLGIFTHGDFVRAFQKNSAIADSEIGNFMTPYPISIHADKLAAEVLAIFQMNRVDELVVINDDHQPVGLVDTQDLSRMRLF